jgi:acyl dehydratase
MSDQHAEDSSVADEIRWPQPLSAVHGPFSVDRIDGAAAGMGEHGPATAALAANGLVAPDLITGMTLFLLARQPRGERSTTGSDPAVKGSAIAGGVWVRERFTIHRPLDRNERFEVTGQSEGRHIRRGRRYGTTSSRTVDGHNRVVATNLTTGLLSYKADPDLADQVEGVSPDDLPTPGPDHGAASGNPCIDAVAGAVAGQVLGGQPMTITLGMMAARDTSNPDNPIHSDLDAAKAAGLERPIAGGSHVLAFALEPLLAAWGGDALFHGAAFDVRWRAPTHCDVEIVPTATVTAVHADLVEAELKVDLIDGGATAMTGTVVVPLPGR